MGKPPRKLRQLAASPGVEKRVLDYMVELLRRSDYTASPANSSSKREVDILAYRDEFGQRRQYAIEVKAHIKPVGADEIRRLAGYMSDAGGLNEVWLVGNNFTHSAREAANHFEKLRLLTFEDFEEAMRRPKQEKPRKGRTVVGKAVLVNHAQIVTTTAAMLVLIDERLSSLREERPNSPDRKSEKKEDMAQYERLKVDVVAIASAVQQFRQGAIKEAEVSKATKTFSDGVRGWWTKSYDKICDKALDISLFLSAVGICSMAGSGGQMAVVVSAALVGGKPIASVLRDVAKKITSD
jgi:hypothetical protein